MPLQPADAPQVAPPPVVEGGAPPKAAAGRPKGAGKGPPLPKAGNGKKPPAARAGRRGSVGEQAQERWFVGRPLRWGELRDAGDVKDTIFSTASNGVVELAAGFDWADFEAFRVKRDQDLAEASPALQREAEASAVLTQRQGTLCLIALHKTNDFQDLVARLESLEAIGEEESGRLQDLLDLVGEQAQKLLELGDKLPQGPSPPSPQGPRLSSFERQLLPLLRVTRARERLRLARIGMTAGARSASLCSIGSELRESAEAACQSNALKDLVRAALTLRDYAQYGPDAPARRAAAGDRVMDISCLLSGFRKFEAAAASPLDKKSNLLRFLAASVMRVRPDFDEQLETELDGLDGVTTSAPWSVFADGLAQLQSDAAFAARFAAELAATGPPGSPHGARAEQLGALAERAAADASQANERATAELDRLARYFGVKGQKTAQEPPGVAVLRDLEGVLRGFRAACGEVHEMQQQSAAQGRASGRGAIRHTKSMPAALLDSAVALLGGETPRGETPPGGRGGRGLFADRKPG